MTTLHWTHDYRALDSCHSRHCREESICSWRTAANTTCHRCHHWRCPSPVHKPGINNLHLFITQTVSQLSSVISKLYYLRQRIV